jgi:hypothetical protein
MMSLVPVLKEAYSYEFKDKPNYGVLKFLLEKQIMELYGLPDTHYSWL